MQKRAVIVLSVFLFLISCTTTSTHREPNSLLSGMDLIKSQDLDKVSSSKNLKFSQADILVDNDDAFESKLDILRSAKSGQTLRLIYYIYAHDHSSAIFTEELIKAAQRGVKVRLLLDYFMNYGSSDALLEMEKQGRGNLEVRFYGKPTDLMIRDARFLTLPCPKATKKSKASDCSDSKWKTIGKGKPQDADVYARLLLSGIYSQNLEILKLAILGGQEIDLTAFGISNHFNQPENRSVASEEGMNLESIFNNVMLLKEGKIDRSYLARLKISLGLLFMGGTLNPLLYEVFGRIPLEQPGPYSWDDWLHFTDYTHHKLLLLDDSVMQLGGRNIENSYHMKKNHLSDKYIFRDTDFYGHISQGGKGVVQSFDRLWSYRSMVWSLKESNRFMPHDWAVNGDWLKKSLDICKAHLGKNRTDLLKCLNIQMSDDSYKKPEERLSAVEKNWSKKAATYRKEYVRQPSEKIFKISDAEAGAMTSYYLENLPFSLVDKKNGPEGRIFGASNRSWMPWADGREELNGKNIHAAWVKELEHVCEDSRLSGQERRVVFHNAYYMPPANLITAFGKMLDGRWNCPKVKVTFITNSEKSTDLFIINVFAKYQLRAFFDVYRKKRGNGPKFEYLEYKGSDAEGGKLSLHSKVTVFGNDILVGSANLDVRSFYMDTNNGMLLRNVPQTVQDYEAWIAELRRSGLIEDKTQLYLRGESLETLRARDWQMAKEEIEKIKPELVQGKNGEFLKKLIYDLSGYIYKLSLQLSDYSEIPVQGEATDNSSQQKSKQQMLETTYDSLLQLI